MATSFGTGRIGWRAAYILGCYNVAAYAIVAFCFFGFGIHSVAGNALLALGFSIGAAVTASLMILNGGVLAALPYFLFGSAVFYGAGTFFATMDTEAMASLSFTEDAQRAILTKVNAINALSILIVTLVAGLFCYDGPKQLRSQRSGMARTLTWLRGLQLPFLLASLPYVALLWLTFSRDANPMIDSIMSMMRGLPLFAVLLGAINWPGLPMISRFLIALVAVGMSLHGILMLAKLAALLPLITLAIGWWLNGKMRRAALWALATMCLLYFSGFAEAVRIGRLHALYEPFGNSISERVDILSDTITQFEDLSEETTDGIISQRFTIAPFQAYFINAYDSGTPGDSLRNALLVLIPRFVWPDKPIIAGGREFDLIFRGIEVESSLAIGYPAEAYWNQGWLGVIAVAILIGAEIGWLTRKWFLFVDQGTPHVGLFIFSAMAVFQAFWVEANIVGAYIGGMTKLFLMILMVDLIARWVSGRLARERSEARLARMRASEAYRS